ncbi:MAG: nitronate monooxygenase [Melioribacteraceae bacterium]|nr:nitronate monooxygenase [Melioribacteraceae bacterium]
MMKNNRITKLFNIQYPIIQAGMVWVSGWKLASTVSAKGGLGLIGSGSMKPDLLREHITKCKAASSKPFGINIPLLRGDAIDLIKVVIAEGIKIVFTSAGHPGKYIDELKTSNITVVHVVANVKQGLKAQSVGCDAVVGEGVEAGGHNGPDEITTFCLIPQLADELNIPVIAAGGIADGRGMAAAFSLGAEGVQIGTRFAATVESSAHPEYKKSIVNASDTDTVLILKKIGMARMIKNIFSDEVLKMEKDGADDIILREKLGHKREMTGIFEGNKEQGIMEAGQASGLIKDIPSAGELFDRLIAEYNSVREKL